MQYPSAAAYSWFLFLLWLIDTKLTWSQTVLVSNVSTDTLCLYFRGITLQAESRKEYEEVKIFSWFCYSCIQVSLENSISFFPSSGYVPLTTSPDRSISLTIHRWELFSMCKFIPSNLLSPSSLRGSVKYVCKRAVCSCFHRQLQSSWIRQPYKQWLPLPSLEKNMKFTTPGNILACMVCVLSHALFTG